MWIFSLIKIRPLYKKVSQSHPTYLLLIQRSQLDTINYSDKKYILILIGDNGTYLKIKLMS